MIAEVQTRTAFSMLRYAQCWEDADILLAGLDIQPGDACFSIASAGDNALAMLTRDPGRVLAVDLSAEQLASLELRVAAYRELEHRELLRLMGSRAGSDRLYLYRRCRPLLSLDARDFWDAQTNLVEGGIGAAGKFEHYFAAFRTRVLPLVHRPALVEQLFQRRDAAGRRDFYELHWNNWRWRTMFRLFFSRFVMGRAGRDPEFFRYVEGSVADRILDRARHALVNLDPVENPYLHWIFHGTHGRTLPCALREENFDCIRSRLDRLEWRIQSLEDFLASDECGHFHRFNLSDVFEYVSEASHEQSLRRIASVAPRGARLAYWNLLVPRSRPSTMEDQLVPVSTAARLHELDKAFFYDAFVVEEVRRS